MSGDPYRASTGALERPGAEEAWDRERYDRGRGFEVRDEHFSHGALPVRAREPSVERYTRPHPPAASPRVAYPDGASDISPQRYVPLPRRPPVDEFYEQRYVEQDRREVRRFSPSPPPAPRPGLLRRQSSLTTYDRLPARFYEQPPERYGPPARRADYIPPPYVPDPLPRSRQLPPAAAMPRGYYDDEDFRPVREREYVHERRRSRRRHRGRSRTRSRSRESRTTTTRSPTATSRSSSTSSSSSSSSGGTTVKSPKNEYPKKGKTRIPARLLSKRALHDLKYPFEEDGATIVILMALGQKNIDDLLKLSEDYIKTELEAQKPPVAILPAPAPAPVVVTPHPGHGHGHGHVTAGYGTHGHMTAGYGVHGHMTAGSVSSADVIEVAPPVGPPLELEETKKVSVVRETSLDRSYTSGYASTSGSHYIDDFEDREHTHIGPLILAKDGHRRRKSKSRSRSRSTRRGERAIDAEIRALEAERDALRHGHRHRRHRSASVGGDTVRYHERLSDGSLVVYEEKVEEFDDDSRHHHHHHHHSHSSSSHSRHHSRGPRIERDKKGRMSIKIPRY